MHNYIPRCLPDYPPATNNRDWLSFFIGGVVGSILVLALDKLFENYNNKRRQKLSEINVLQALRVEIDNNLELCEQIKSALTNESKNQVYNFAPFKKVWINKYLEDFTDYTDTKSLEIYKFLISVSDSFELIANLQNRQSLLSVGTAISNIYVALISMNNRQILLSVTECQSLLMEVANIKFGTKNAKHKTKSKKKH